MKGKKILVIVIIIVAVLAVAGTVFGYLFLKTDLLKSNKELFAKYVNQNFDSFKEISNLKIIYIRYVANRLKYYNISVHFGWEF